MEAELEAAPAPDPEPEPEPAPKPKWVVKDYTVAKEKDISSSNRLRRHLWIVAPTALTPESRIATLMEAAVRVHREQHPQYIGAFLLPFESSGDPMARIKYAPDGCGVSGSDCTGEMWTDAAASESALTPMQLVIRKDWDANRDRFKDTDGFVEEPRLYQFLANKHNMTTKAVRAEMLGFAIATSPSKMELPRDLRTKGKLTEKEQTRSDEVACRADLQCWGDKHSLRATRPCQLVIEQLARYDYEWTDGWGSKFKKMAWKDRKAGILTYFGSEIKFQNGFGAWQKMSYACDYDTNTEKVLDVRIN